MGSPIQPKGSPQQKQEAVDTLITFLEKSYDCDFLLILVCDICCLYVEYCVVTLKGVKTQYDCINQRHVRILMEVHIGDL